MASFFEQADRNVIPNWRSFANTAKLGEVNGLIQKNSQFKPDISILLEDWEAERNIGIAAEIVSIASAFNLESEKIAEASDYILSNNEKSSQELLRAAQTLTARDCPKDDRLLEMPSLDQFSNITSLNSIFQQINILKKRLIDNPANAIAWVDIGRYYSILGQNDQARKAILNAVQLQPGNRFVLRSMARFFAHNDEVDLAHDILRKQDVTKFDPWLVATEIALARLRHRSSVFVKTGFNLTQDSNNSSFNLSELHSALGTLEMQNGNHKKSRKLFASSLEDPNDNVLAQVEWASQKDRSISFNIVGQKLTNAFEASARLSFENQHWQESLDQTIAWFLDLPFSKLPIIFGSHIARTHLNDHKQAISLGKTGLIAHPNDPILINNLIYSMSILGEISEAEALLRKYENLPKTENEKVYWIATKGLFYFRKGLPDVGRHFYHESIELARESKNRLVFNLAVVNYTREEVIANPRNSDQLLSQLDNLIKDETNASVLKTRQEIVDIIKAKECD